MNLDTMVPTELNQAAFDAFLEMREDPGWLQEQRREAWAVFSQMQWPARNSEEWSRTDIRLLNVEHYPLLTASPATASVAQPHLNQGVDLAGQSVCRNGNSSLVDFQKKWAERGVIFGSLDQLATEHEALVKDHLMTRAMNRQYDRFAALHAACWTGGHFLYVPRGVVVDEPFHMVSVLSDGQADLGHTLCILEEGAEATVLTETLSEQTDDDGFHCGGVELLVAPNAHLRYVNLQNWGSRVWHFAHHNAIVEQDASLQWTVATMGSRLAKVNQHVALTGKGADAQVNGVMFTEGKQHMCYNTLQHHVAPHGHSDFLYKAALQDRSRTVWRGMIKVDAVAQQTDGYQRNDNLLLNDGARADSIPGLEIEADDVRCTHGSTTGRVDEELLFYAQCRGFTRTEAMRVIVTGFFQQIFDRVTIESVRNALAEAIAQRVRNYV
ncbi:MAG: Fe-S cluster assembly protein SufD [Pirellulaceae bacterium]